MSPPSSFALSRSCPSQRDALSVSAEKVFFGSFVNAICTEVGKRVISAVVIFIALGYCASVAVVIDVRCVLARIKL